MTEEPDAADRHEKNEPAETANALTSDTRGRWIVTSQGATHLWDLDEGTYTRRPGPASPSGPFDYDGIAHRIKRVTRWPCVGDQSLVWFDDPASPFDREQFRRSSVIVSITRAPGVADDDCAAGTEPGGG